MTFREPPKCSRGDLAPETDMFSLRRSCCLESKVWEVGGVVSSASLRHPSSTVFVPRIAFCFCHSSLIIAASRSMSCGHSQSIWRGLLVAAAVLNPASSLSSRCSSTCRCTSAISRASRAWRSAMRAHRLVVSASSASSKTLFADSRSVSALLCCCCCSTSDPCTMQSSWMVASSLSGIRAVVATASSCSAPDFFSCWCCRASCKPSTTEESLLWPPASRCSNCESNLQGPSSIS
mmetsp:Transcript_4150/g.7844  ORF Transcript_4150/g.7844 Transcript_4150/m.7844 type:complete len:235 (+) Transcript_4150:128-832(+)